MSDVQFAILGPLEVRRDGQVLDLGGPKQRAVLAFLLTHRREPVSLDRMIDQLWGEDAPPEGHRLAPGLRVEPATGPRARPGPAGTARILVSRPPGYALDVETGALDAMRFEEAADEARRALAAGDAAAALAHAERARSEWRGEVLVDFPYEEFAEAERTRLTERRVGLEQDRAAALLELDRPADAAEVAEALAAAHPLREQVWELLMLARYRSGRQADALRAFQDARRMLGEELGLEPGPALRRLEAQILGQDRALDRSSPAPATARARPATPTRPRPPPSARCSSDGPTRSTACTQALASATRVAAAFALV